MGEGKSSEQRLTAYAPDMPVAILYHVSQPDENIFLAELQHLPRDIRQHKLIRITPIL